jgi:signal transduction histidine kinase
VDALVATVGLVEHALATLDEDPAAARAHAAALMTRVAGLVARARDVVQSIDDLERTGGRCEAGRAITGGDVHDVLGHGLSLAAVLAGAAHATLPADPRRAQMMLAQAAAVLAQAHEEIMPLLGERQAAQREAGAGRDALDLALLVAWAVDAGEEVTLDADWSAVSAASAPVLDAAHRVLQEALTNARKHAPAAPVAVSVRVAAERLLIDVTSGRGASTCGDPLGRGLAVMRRRAESLGGRVVVNSRPSSFSLRVSLPLGRSA